LLKRSSDDLRLAKELLDKSKSTQRELTNSADATKQELTNLQKEGSELRKTAEEKTAASEKATQKSIKLEEEVVSLRNKLDKLRAGTIDSRSKSKSGGDDDILMEQIKDLRLKMRCSVCNDREKAVVIARKHCFHMFCRECIQKNLETRSRKCPGCGKGFAESDVHPIYL